MAPTDFFPQAELAGVAPLTSSTRSSGADQQSTGSTSTGRRSSGGKLRKLLVWGGLLAVGYVVARRARSGDLPKSTDSIREKAGEALPGEGQTIPIGDTGGETSSESGSDDYTSDQRTAGDSGGETIGTGQTGGDQTSSATGSGSDEFGSAGETTSTGSGETTTGAGGSVGDDRPEDDEQSS